jgi:hypothetical protein
MTLLAGANRKIAIRITLILLCILLVLEFGPFGEPTVAGIFYTNEITQKRQFEEMGVASDGLIKGGKSVKFLVDNKNLNSPKIYFLDGNYVERGAVPSFVQLHYDFARKVGFQLPLDTFNNQTYFTNDLTKKTFLAGTVQSYDVEMDGTQKQFYGIQFYPQDLIAEKTLLHALKVVTRAFKVDGKLAFVSQGAQQTFSTIRADLAALGLEAYTIDKVLGATKYIPMNGGEAYGILRLYPTSVEELSPTDIPVFKELPLDLSVVAGAITVAFQDPLCHVNLKSKERKTPNMVLRDEKALEGLAARNGKPVRLIVRNDRYEIADSTLAEVQKKYLQKVSNKWTPIPLGNETRILPYDRICPGKAVDCVKSGISFGGKAAKLGFLSHPTVLGKGSDPVKLVGYPIVPDGFAVPIKFYFEFVDANPRLKEKLSQFFEKEMSTDPLPPLERAKWAKEIQELFYQSAIPADMHAALNSALESMKARVLSANPGMVLKKVRIRSSANAEDMPEFDGAGLHSSFSAKLAVPSNPAEPCALVEEAGGAAVVTKAEMRPETFACAIKGVYASLWNKRAIEERSYKRLDQKTAAMGLAIQPTYGSFKEIGFPEAGNLVAVTRVVNSPAIYGYTISSNLGDNLVTNPIPGTQSEIVIASFVGDEPVGLSPIQLAKPTPDGPVRRQMILNREAFIQIVELARHVELQYCRNVPDYYRGGAGACVEVEYDRTKPFALDMEFKILGSGNNVRIMLKQVREFSGQ